MGRCKVFLGVLSFLVLSGVIIYVTLKYKCPDFSKAAVAADSKTCSEIGRDILQQGGSAVDAAIAALLCTSVINPQSSGIGGGAIFTVMDSSGNVKIINSRETVPANVTYTVLDSNSKPCSNTRGNKWIGVPGEIRGYEAAHKLYGKLPWATLFQPTIKLAREGIKIPEVQGSSIPSIPNTDETRALWKLFSDKKGNLLKIGGTVKFEKLADTLEIIANNGADSFYSGKIAEDLVHDVQQAGGILTLQDLAMYKVNVTDAWTVPLGEYQMYIPPPPAGGAVLSLVLNILKEYQMNSAPESSDEKTRFYHLYAEAFKFANRLKKHIRNPNFTKILTEDGFASKIRAKIKTNMTLISDYNIPLNPTDSQTDDDPSRSPVSGGTTHVSVLAEDGSAVSVTSSINNVFGSKIYSSQTGVILNDQLDDFCGRVNNISPGERPPSSFSPSVLKSKSKTLVIGASGGDFIMTAMASTLINHLWFKKSLKEAIDDPVIFVDPEDKVIFEPKWDKVKHLEYFYVNAVEKDCGCIYAVSDTRKNGKAAGY
uniref:Gamma-glutamyltransferase 5a n=1 Tax=Kryptolebias marmoratus TaxID=37003 RepID=A0A3Q3AFW1_KRYMA